MRPQRCRLPMRIALASILAVPALAGTYIGAAAASPVTLAVHVGYQDVVKPGEWMPVTIDAKNTGAGLDGTLEIQEVLNAQPGVGGGFAIYHESISLASGASKRIRTYVLEDTTGATITARIVQNGRLVGSQDSGTGSPTSTLICVLSDLAAALPIDASGSTIVIATAMAGLRVEVANGT